MGGGRSDRINNPVIILRSSWYLTLVEDEPSSGHKPAEAAGEKEVGDGDEVQKGGQMIVNTFILLYVQEVVTHFI